MAETAEEHDAGGSGRTILVDGFNVLHTVLMKTDRPDGWWKSEQRERLLARVAGWRGGADEIWVAFDGSRPEEAVWTPPDTHAAPPGPAPIVRSLFAESADDWIVRQARRAEDPARILVVSADRQVTGRAQSAGVEVLSPWSFIAECDEAYDAASAATADEAREKTPGETPEKADADAARTDDGD